MSISTWRAEFLPVLGSSPEATANDLTATNHSISKWLGFTEENLEKHELVWQNESHSVLLDTGGVTLSVWECALCCWSELEMRKHTETDPDPETYRGWSKVSHNKFCMFCPILKSHGKSCDKGEDSAWAQWHSRKDPMPMITTLQLTKEWIERNSKRAK